MQGTGRLSPDSRRLSLSWWFRTATLVMFCSGCRTTHVVTTDATGRPRFEEATVTYEIVDPALARLRSSTLTLADAKARPLRTALISRASRSVETKARSELRLVMHVPHPRGDAETALALLQAPTDHADSWITVARRDFPRAEVDLLLAHLHSGGVFDDQMRPGSHTRIAVEIDGHRVEKPWTRVPRLDRLAVETYDARN